MKCGRSVVVFSFGTLLGLASTAEAQTAWDVSAMAGLFSGRPEIAGNQQQYDTWFNAAQGAVTVGRYLTPHVKLELEASTTGTGRQHVERVVTVPGAPIRYPIGSELESSVRSLAVAATWQFFENEWVHPFVTAGVSADVQHQIERFWPQYYTTGDPRVPGNQIQLVPARDESRTTTVASGLVAGGAKFYVNERMFVRTDARVTIGADQRTLVLRCGFGFDF